MTRFRMLLIVVASAMVFTFVGPFLYRAVGLDSPVGSCSPVGNSSAVGDNSPVGDCSPTGTGVPTTISNSLSGGGQSGGVITVAAGTAVTDQATLSAVDDTPAPSGNAGVAEAMAKFVTSDKSGASLPDAGGTVTYSIYSLNPHQWGWDNHQWGWGWHWNQVASGGTVTVTNGVVPSSNPVTLDPGVYAWQASYSGDDTYAPSQNHRSSGIQIVQRGGSGCWGGGWSCDHSSGGHGDGNGNGGGNSSGGGSGYSNHGGNSGGGSGGSNGGGGDNYAGYSGHGGGNSYGDGGGNSYGYGENGGGRGDTASGWGR